MRYKSRKKLMAGLMVVAIVLGIFVVPVRAHAYSKENPETENLEIEEEVYGPLTGL